MVDIRWAGPADLNAVNALWEQVFGDKPAVQAGIIAAFGGMERVLLLVEDGVVRSMTCLPLITLRTARGMGEKAAYLYALATHPEARGRGLGSRLIGGGEELLRAQGCAAVALVPAQPSLFDYYRPLGYTPAFFHSRLEWEGPVGLPPAPGGLVAIGPEEYGGLRKGWLRGLPHVEYPPAMTALQGFVSRISGGGLYRLELSRGAGCAAVEGRDGPVWVKELLCHPADVEEALARLTSAHPAPAYRVCAPAGMGLDGETLPFGVIRRLDGKAAEAGGYLGLAFD